MSALLKFSASLLTSAFALTLQPTTFSVQFSVEDTSSGGSVHPLAALPRLSLNSPPQTIGSLLTSLSEVLNEHPAAHNLEPVWLSVGPTILSLTSDYRVKDDINFSENAPVVGFKSARMCLQVKKAPVQARIVLVDDEVGQMRELGNSRRISAATLREGVEVALEEFGQDFLPVSVRMNGGEMITFEEESPVSVEESLMLSPGEEPESEDATLSSSRRISNASSFRRSVGSASFNGLSPLLNPLSPLDDSFLSEPPSTAFTLFVKRRSASSSTRTSSSSYYSGGADYSFRPSMSGNTTFTSPLPARMSLASSVSRRTSYVPPTTPMIPEEESVHIDMAGILSGEINRGSAPRIVVTPPPQEVGTVARPEGCSTEAPPRRPVMAAPRRAHGGA